MQRHDPGRNRLAALVEVPLRLTAMARRVLSRALAQSPHGLLPGFHVSPMLLLQPREAERPSVKGCELRNRGVDLVFDLFGAFSKSRNVFLPCVCFYPVLRLRPMPSSTNSLQALIPTTLTAGSSQFIREPRQIPA